ncbi:MAG: hypothetical protein AAF456_03555 [Planctomycetota bacterium]
MVFRFDSAGIGTQNRVSGEELNKLFAWKDLVSVEFDRIDPKRRDFKLMIVDTGAERIRFSREDKKLRWTQSIRMRVNHLVHLHLEESRIITNIVGEPKQTTKRIDEEISKQKKAGCDVLLIVLFPAMFSLPLLITDGFRGAAMALSYLVQSGPIALLARRACGKRIRELTRTKADVIQQIARGYARHPGQGS